MSRHRKRTEWLPGLWLLAVAIGLGAVIGYAAGTGRVPIYLSTTVLLLAAGLVVRAGWERRRAVPRLARGRARLTTVRDGERIPYDLAEDNSTDDQEYEM